MSLQLERLASRPQAIQTFVLPDVPKLPPQFVRQFRLEEYEAGWERWRQNAQTGIREALQQVQSQNQTE